MLFHEIISQFLLSKKILFLHLKISVLPYFNAFIKRTKVMRLRPSKYVIWTDYTR